MHGYWYNGFDNMMNNGFDNMMNFGYENSWWFMIYDGLKLLVIIGAVIFIAKMLMNGKLPLVNVMTHIKKVNVLKAILLSIVRLQDR